MGKIQETLDKCNEVLYITDDIEKICPECGEPLIEKWSSVKC